MSIFTTGLSRPYLVGAVALAATRSVLPAREVHRHRRPDHGRHRKDRFRITASGLKPQTAFTVFLIEKAGAPFGAVEYIGDITTDAYGKASNTFDLIVEEAFAFNNETSVRKELNSVGLWFADPKDDDACLGAASPVTQFDGDASAGVQMMNSGAAVLP